MINKIRRAAVLGAGVMGSGIAGHLANAGIPVLMLDIVPPNPGPDDDTSDPAFRNKFAAGGLAKMLKQKPAPLFTNKAKSLITVGNFDDDLHKIGDCDWICEVVKEDLAIKQSLFAKVDEFRREGSIISSNTSGLSVAGMLEGRSDDFRKNFLVTHFFNPVRYMKLLELVEGDDTDPAVMQFMSEFGANVLGKGIVYAKDTTNFIANRIGAYGMCKTLHVMVRDGHSVEMVDKVFGPATGRPKSAVFKTADLVGLDTFAHVAKNCYDSLPDDEERDVFQLPDFVYGMIEKGYLGRKAKSGFYKMIKESGKRTVLSIDTDTLEYSEQEKIRFDSLGVARKEKDTNKRLKGVVNSDDPAGKLAREVTYATLAYSARRMGEIADDVVNIDRGLRWGYGWELGPFEAWDAIGVKESLAEMKSDDVDVPAWVVDMVETGHETFYSKDDAGFPTYYDLAEKGYKRVPLSAREHNLTLLKSTGRATKIAGNLSASTWDLGDGILGLEFHSALNAKMNPIDDDIVGMMDKACDELEQNFDGMVIYHDGENFSAGANLLLVFMQIQQGNWDDLRTIVTSFQAANQRMRYSSKPVVAAPAGLALGGGAEVVLGANAIQAAAELYIGLVEVGMGLIPGGGGTLNLLKNLYGRYSNDRDFDPAPFIKKAFLTIGMAQVATSAEQGREFGFLKDTDGVTLNRDQLLYAAKQRALGMARTGFTAPQPKRFRLPGPDGAATVDMLLYSMVQNHQISEHDRLIGAKLARVLCGGDTGLTTTVTEEHLLELEAEAFLSLCGEQKTQERIGHFLNTNKPLRN